ncbi:LTA synthase family protein [Zophobihabitans entericus]|uniref:LTA synthase family protein n=1 Tax=Zophobihabitans entericus TaxID=1635327 RepID=A0A6G9I820_9GAMM|nr:LTA synthase family protein [Zophobihabitans entericus]QIQ20355.1 LTA synthase family protein [Zophobihabitans entericus]
MIPFSAWFVLPILLLAPLLAAFFKQKKIQIPIIVFFTVISVTELVSIYFSGGFVDYQFYVNLNLHDIFAGLFIFKLQAALAIGSFVVLVCLLYLLTRLLRRKTNIFFRCTLIVIAIASISYKDGPINKLYQIWQITTVSRTDFVPALEQLGMTDYVMKADLQASKGKNIVVISLESFERGFLANFGVTPNLNRLSYKYTFFDHIPMTMGSSWTTASMYTYMTGMPFLVGGLTTSPLTGAQKTQLVSIGDVLHKAGYQTGYIMGNPHFAGMGHIISMFGISVISEADYPNAYPEAPFGLYDRDIFDIAKLEVEKMRTAKQPFALFISTVSTHAPDGFADERMTQIINNKYTGMDFVAASLDHSLGQFINYLEKEKLLANTVFYIFPDHLMMGAGTKTIEQLSERSRQLYLMTNATEEQLKAQTNHIIYQIDLPRLILNGAQIKTNARFLTDYLGKDTDKQSFIQHYKNTIATINYSAEVLPDDVKQE